MKDKTENKTIFIFFVVIPLILVLFLGWRALLAIPERLDLPALGILSLAVAFLWLGIIYTLMVYLPELADILMKKDRRSRQK